MNQKKQTSTIQIYLGCFLLVCVVFDTRTYISVKIQWPINCKQTNTGTMSARNSSLGGYCFNHVIKQKKASMIDFTCVTEFVFILKPKHRLIIKHHI